MAGGAFFVAGGHDDDNDDEYGLDIDEQGISSHAVQWMGTPGVKGPRWAKMPLLTVGMLGIQVGHDPPIESEPPLTLVRLVDRNGIR